MNPPTKAIRAQVDNTGLRFTARVESKDRTTLVLSYKKTEAQDIRAFIQAISLKGKKKPSLSLLARHAMSEYLRRVMPFIHRSDVMAEEVAKLEKLTTPVQKPMVFIPRKKLA